MKYQLTCQVDGNLIGPLTELIAPYGRVSIKLIDEGEPVQPPLLKLKRRAPVFIPGKGTGPVTVLRALATSPVPLSVREVKAAMTAAGAAPNGSGAVLTKLKRKGYAQWVSDGMWRATPKGEALIKKLDGPNGRGHEPAST